MKQKEINFLVFLSSVLCDYNASIELGSDEIEIYVDGNLVDFDFTDEISVETIGQMFYKGF